jgi:glycosyltransferase involved in cell wall biosynthesis
MVVRPRISIIASHPIQYQVPLFRALSQAADLRVFYAHRQSPEQQAQAGYGVTFDWDLDLFDGYVHEFLNNRARRPSTDSFYGCDTPDVARVLAAERFDAVITMGWYLKSYVQTVRACKRLGMRVLVRGDSTLGNGQGFVKRSLKDLLYPPLLAKFDGFLVVGRRARFYLEHFGITQDRMYWSPHAVDNERFSAGARATKHERGKVRRSLACRRGEFLVLFVGRLVPSKRPLDLVNALALLRRDGLTARGVFVGHGELCEEIESRGTALGVPLTMAGFKNQSELPSIYASADVLVLPSSLETWGLVVNEAMACGTPAIVSDAVGCADDLINPGETGDRYPVGDVLSLASAIGSLISDANSARVKRALERKMSTYSLDMAVRGILRASHGGHEH